MACCNAVFERCAPNGDTVIGILDASTDTTTYKNVDGTDWVGDPETLGSCAATITTTTTYGEGQTLSYDVNLPDGTVLPAGDPIPEGIVFVNEENADGTVVSQCPLPTSNTEIVCETPNPGCVTFRKTDFKTGVVSDQTLTSQMGATQAYQNSLNFGLHNETTPVNTAWVGPNVSGSFVLPHASNVMVDAFAEIFNPNDGPEAGSAVYRLEIRFNGGGWTQLSGNTRFSLNSNDEGVLVGSRFKPGIQGTNTYELRVILIDNDLEPGDGNRSITQMRVDLSWSELVCV